MVAHSELRGTSRSFALKQRGPMDTANRIRKAIPGNYGYKKKEIIFLILKERVSKILMKPSGQYLSNLTKGRFEDDWFIAIRQRKFFVSLFGYQQQNQQGSNTDLLIAH